MEKSILFVTNRKPRRMKTVLATYLRMHLTQNIPRRVRRHLVVNDGRIFPLDRVVFCDFQPLMCLHTVVANELGTFHTPRCGRRLITTATALDQVLGRFHTALWRIVATAVDQLDQELMFDDEFVAIVHFANGALDDVETGRMRGFGDFLFDACAARDVQAFEQFGCIGQGQVLGAPNTFGGFQQQFFGIVFWFVNLEGEERTEKRPFLMYFCEFVLSRKKVN
jgi:hypothetical protein